MLDYMDFKAALITGCRDILEAAAAGSCADSRSDTGGMTAGGCADSMGCLHSSVRIEERTVTKAQRGKLCGLIFSAPGSTCAPTFYVEDLYEMYADGASVEELSFTLSQYALDCITIPPSFPGIDDLDDIDADNLDDRADLGVRLINLSTNHD